MGILRNIASLAFIIVMSCAGIAQGQIFSSQESELFATNSQRQYLAVVDQMGVTDMRNAMILSSHQGFNPRQFWTDSMERTYQRGGYGSAFKTQVNQSYLLYLNSLYSGFIDPMVMSRDIKVRRKPFITPQQLQALVLANRQQAEPVAAALAPQTPPYLSLKAALQRVSQACRSGAWLNIMPASKSLKLGSKHPVIPQLKARLRLLGYPYMSNSDVFDEPMLEAINDIQLGLRFKPDGIISPRGPTWGFFSMSCRDRQRQIQADMEKMRWFPQRFEERNIFVNLMMSYLTLSDPAAGVSMNFKVINGRPERRTPTMMDKMSQVILNPFWVVPPTIFLEDKVEEIKKLQPWEINAYFDQRNYEVWDSKFTQRLDPATINWWSWDPANELKIYIRQKPHLGNALGVIKFMLNNSYAIYLHDTNQRELFQEANRQLSSGCVRVEKPFELAEYMLADTEWTREKIEATVAKPGEVLDKDTEIRVKRPIAVYMVPLTSQVNSDGVLRFSQDTYRHNSVILSRLLPL